MRIKFGDAGANERYRVWPVDATFASETDLMFFGRKDDPVAVTRLVIDTFDHIPEEDLTRRIKRVRRQFPNSPELDLLEALQVSMAVPDLSTFAEVAERSWDAGSFLDEMGRSPNRAAVKALLGKLYCKRFDAHLESIVADANDQLKNTSDAPGVVAVLDDALQTVRAAVGDFEDLPGIHRLGCKWRNKLKVRLERARCEVKEQEKEAAREARRKTREQSKGKCDACGNDPRVLTKLESGLRICRTCLREIRPPRPKHLATLKQIADLRESGMDVPDELTKDQARLLQKLVIAREYGLYIHEGATEAEIDAAIKSRPTSFYTKVVGVTFLNEDDTNRQRILRKCRPGEPLLLIRDPENKFDHNAIKVFKRGRFLFPYRQVGHLSAEVAERIAPLMDRGIPVEATVMQVTGGGGWLWARRNFGMNIRISYRWE